MAGAVGRERQDDERGSVQTVARRAQGRHFDRAVVVVARHLDGAREDVLTANCLVNYESVSCDADCTRMSVIVSRILVTRSQNCDINYTNSLRYGVTTSLRYG